MYESMAEDTEMHPYLVDLPKLEHIIHTWPWSAEVCNRNRSLSGLNLSLWSTYTLVEASGEGIFTWTRGAEVCNRKADFV